MQFLSEKRLAGGIVERTFTLDGIPGMLWMPESASATAPLPLVLTV